MQHLADGITVDIETELIDGVGAVWSAPASSFSVEWVDSLPEDAPRIPGKSIPYRIVGDTLQVMRASVTNTQEASVVLQLACSLVAWPQGAFLVHSAGLCLPGRGAVVVLAESGGGKSTLSTLSESFTGLSDETTLLRVGPPALVSATPFRSQSTKVPEQRTEPLRAFLVLEKSLTPRFTRLPAQEGLRAILRQAYLLPETVAPPRELFARARALAESVPTYRFAFPKDPVADTLLLQLMDEVAPR
jgi:hypothetical protein